MVSTQLPSPHVLDNFLPDMFSCSWGQSEAQKKIWVSVKVLCLDKKNVRQCMCQGREGKTHIISKMLTNKAKYMEEVTIDFTFK